MANEGLYGSETRAEVKDPLAPNRGAPIQPNSVSLSGVSSPRKADFSRIGEGQRVISKLLGEGAGILDSYVERNRKQWELDGQMAYAQGVAEADLAKSGNKYNMAGFLTMKTQTAAMQFMQNEYEQIENGARSENPEEYRASLSKRFSEMSKQLGNDPFVTRLLGAAAGETFPKLVAQQVKSNNAWREEQTEQSYGSLLVSQGTMNDPQSPDGGDSPDHLRKLLSPEVSGLSLDKHKKVITEAIGNTLALGDTRLAQAFISGDKTSDGINIRDLPPQKALMNQSIDFVLGIEGGYVPNDGGQGPTNFGINSQANELTPEQTKNLTPADARKIYEEKYWNKVVTPDMSADMSLAAFDAAVNQGVGFTTKALKESGGDLDKFLQLRRERYMQSAQDPALAGNLSGWLNRLDKLQTASMDGRSMTSTVKALVDEKKIMMTMIKNGFNEAQINHVQSAWKQYNSTKDAEFDKGRYLNEQSLVNTARKEGNFPQMLNQIETVKQVNGYSDKWANEMAGKVQTQVSEYDKEQTEFKRIDSVGTNGGLANESADKQKTGIDRKRAEIIGRVQAKAELNDTQKNALIRQDMAEFLVRNGVKDTTWEKSIAVGLSGDIVTKDGTVNPRSLKAYEDYLWLKENTPFGYAQGYVSGDAAKLVAQAEAFDVKMNSDVALATAAQVISNKDKNLNITPKPIHEARVQKMVKDKIDEELDPGIFSFVSKFQAADAFDVKDTDVMRWKSNPVLHKYINNLAINEQASDPTGTTTPEAAINMAWNSAIPRLEMAPAGNVLISGPDKTIREELGFPKAHATNLVFKAMQNVGARFGKAYFGPRYQGPTVEADKQFAIYKQRNPSAGTTGKDERWLLGGKLIDAVSDFPESKMTWDSDRKGIHWVLTKRDEFGNVVPDGDSVFIPADVLRGVMLEEQVAERSERSLADYTKNVIQDINQSVFGKN